MFRIRHCQLMDPFPCKVNLLPVLWGSKLQEHLVGLNGFLGQSQLVLHEGFVEPGVSTRWGDIDGSLKARLALLEPLEDPECIPFVVPGLQLGRVDLCGLRVRIECLFKTAQVPEETTLVVPIDRVLRVNLEGHRVRLKSFFCAL